MDYIEALEWLGGFRSACNIIPIEPFETKEVRIAQADAAYMQQAYYIAKAHKEGLIPMTVKDGGNLETMRGTDGEDTKAMRRNIISISHKKEGE